MTEKHDLTTEAGRLASMLDFYATERQKAQDAGLWYEVRHWQELPEGHFGTPSHWAPIAYATSRNSAALVAEALHLSRDWYCEVWSCSPVRDPDIPPASSAPVAWHLCDIEPPRTYPNDWPRPKSGNPGEEP